MSIIKFKSFEVVNTNDNLKAIYEKFIAALDLMPDQRVTITLEVLDDITKMKKRYFAMVRDLSVHAGYVSHLEKEIFKGQVKKQLHVESIADIKTKEDMMAILEALHQIAGEHYHYTFKDEGNDDIITFNR